MSVSRILNWSLPVALISWCACGWVLQQMPWNAFESVTFGIVSLTAIFASIISLAIFFGFNVTVGFRDPVSCEFWAMLRSREEEDESKYYSNYCRSAGIQPSLPARLRDDLESAVGVSLKGIRPSDNLWHAFPDLDGADLHYRLQRTFHLNIPQELWKDVDGTFGSLLTCLNGSVTQALNPMQPNSAGGTGTDAVESN